MAKFSRYSTKAAATSPVTSAGPALTAEGGLATAYDAKGQLYTLAVTNMVSEGAFYERGESRDNRYTSLIAAVAAEDPAWLTGLFPWLRTEGFMRSASLQGAAETAKALCDAHRYDGVEDMVDSVLRRADEPREFLAYWRSIAGGKFPKRYMPVKNGLKRAVQRLFTEYNWLKWDSTKTDMRFADVIDLVHPAPLDDAQSELFKYILDRRHNRPVNGIPDSLTMLRKNALLRSEADPKDWLNTQVLKDAGMTWEDALSAVGSKLDKKKVWEALIPNMGLMALCRNLRNFDQAGVSDKVAAQVAARLADPEQITRSKMFPFRFLAAYRNAPSLRWSYPLEQAVNASLANVPELGGRTLILVDMSGSMSAMLSDRSQLSRSDAASVFGAALALRSAKVDLVEFGTDSGPVAVRKGDSALKVVERFRHRGGTNTVRAVRKHFAGHDRVVILTDGQSFDGDPADVIPKNVPLYTWDLAGYGVGSTAGVPNRHVFGGMSDSSFQAIPMLERGRSAKWPWEN